MVRTSDSDSGDRGSIPRRITHFSDLIESIKCILVAH